MENTGETERIERVAEMEARMDQVLAAAQAMETALEDWEAAQPALEELSAYYDGPLWQADYEADEAGELPAELKRGVLSQDGLWDLLIRAGELNERLRED